MRYIPPGAPRVPVVRFHLMSRPVPISRITVERSLLAEMLRGMQQLGQHGCELLVLWLGDIDANGYATVRNAFVPKQKPIAGEDGVGYFVTGETLFHLNRGLSETGLRLIAQVHSHPTVAYHSEADDRYAIVTADGGLSLVVPNFGHAAVDPATWAVYRLRHKQWQELSEPEVQQLFSVRES
jgi:Prokaryotic homologs of the JAB domain